MRGLVLSMVTAGVLLTAGGSLAGRPEPVTDLDAALKKAKTEGKLVFVELGREGCGNCRALKGYIKSGMLRLRDSRFIYADLNCDDDGANRAFSQRFKVEGRMLPFVVIADSDGKQLAARSGYGEAQDFDDLIREGEKKAPKKEGAAGKTLRSAKTGPSVPKKIARDESRASRTWTSRSGSQVEASLFEESSGYLVLKKTDGSKIQVRPASLSDEDVAYVNDLREGGGKGEGQAVEKVEKE